MNPPPVRAIVNLLSSLPRAERKAAADRGYDWAIAHPTPWAWADLAAWLAGVGFGLALSEHP